jgi:hypothetical protein
MWLCKRSCYTGRLLVMWLVLRALLPLLLLLRLV